MLERLASEKSAESTWDVNYAKLLVAKAMEGMRSDFAPRTWDALRLVMSDGVSVDRAGTETGVSSWTIYSAKSRSLLSGYRQALSKLQTGVGNIGRFGVRHG